MKLALALASIAVCCSARVFVPFLSAGDFAAASTSRSNGANSTIEVLFQRRQAAAPAAGGSYPPEDVPGPTPRPEWVQAYQAAKSAGLIPSFPPSVLSGGAPSYQAVNGASAQVCSWTVSKCIDGDVVDAPAGMTGIAFDDGPQQPTATLLPFLRSVNQTATHFMIGSRILDNLQLLQQAVQQNHDHIAVHTWSHPYMTTLNDQQVLGELGWTMQIIFDHTGYVPAWWRPPYGDVDARVRAIAKHVFGLTTVIWNHDTNDWCLTDGSGSGSACSPGQGIPANAQALQAELQAFYSQPKNPGLIILEHELAMRPVQGFIAFWPNIKAGGWIPKAIPDLFNAAWYQNANDDVIPTPPAATGAAAVLPNPNSPFLAVTDATPPPIPTSTSTPAPAPPSAPSSTSPGTADKAASAAPSARPSSAAAGVDVPAAGQTAVMVGLGAMAMVLSL